jgi:hypothetical protein
MDNLLTVGRRRTGAVLAALLIISAALAGCSQLGPGTPVGLLAYTPSPSPTPSGPFADSVNLTVTPRSALPGEVLYPKPAFNCETPTSTSTSSSTATPTPSPAAILYTFDGVLLPEPLIVPTDAKPGLHTLAAACDWPTVDLAHSGHTPVMVLGIIPSRTSGTTAQPVTLRLLGFDCPVAGVVFDKQPVGQTPVNAGNATFNLTIASGTTPGIHEIAAYCLTPVAIDARIAGRTSWPTIRYLVMSVTPTLSPTAAPAQPSGPAGWVWILVAVVVAAAAIWGIARMSRRGGRGATTSAGDGPGNGPRPPGIRVRLEIGPSHVRIDDDNPPKARNGS